MLLMMVLTDEQSDLVSKLYKKYYELFYSIAYGILGSKSAAEDAVHTSFAIISEKIDKISQIPCPQMRSYCIVIVENEALMIVRSNRKLVLGESLDEKATSNDMEPEEYAVRNEEVETIWKYVSMLSDEDQKLVIMRYYEKMGFQQIADHFGITREAARKRGQRVLKRLKNLMEEDSFTEE